MCTDGEWKGGRKVISKQLTLFSVAVACELFVSVIIVTPPGYDDWLIKDSGLGFVRPFFTGITSFTRAPCPAGFG